MSNYRPDQPMTLLAILATTTAVAVLAVGADVAASRGSAAPGVAARCESRAFTVEYNPPGLVTVLEYAYPRRDKTPGAFPTGRKLASMGYGTGTPQVASFCTRVERPRLPAPAKQRQLAGPYGRDNVETRVFCMKTAAVWDADFGRFVEVDIAPVLDRAKRRVGNKMYIKIDGVFVFSASVTRTDGTYAFDYFRCMRNPPF